VTLDKIHVLIERKQEIMQQKTFCWASTSTDSALWKIYMKLIRIMPDKIPVMGLNILELN